MTNQMNSIKSSAGPIVGEIAPNFNLKTIQGTSIQLSDFVGDKRVLLWFSRGFTCPYCRGYMDMVIEGYEDIKQGNIEIIQISPNLLQSAIKFFGDHAPPYPMVFDPDKRLFANYGIGRKGTLAATGLMTKSMIEAGKRREFGKTMRATAIDVVDTRFLQRLHHHALTATNQAIVAIGIDGRIKHRHEVAPLEDLPAAPTMIKFLQNGSA